MSPYSGTPRDPARRDRQWAKIWAHEDRMAELERNEPAAQAALFARMMQLSHEAFEKDLPELERWHERNNRRWRVRRQAFPIAVRARWRKRNQRRRARRRLLERKVAPPTRRRGRQLDRKAVRWELARRRRLARLAARTPQPRP